MKRAGRGHKLVTAEIRRKLVANHEARVADPLAEDHDPHPVAKYFSPWSGATWLVTELDPEDDRLFGLCDMGQGFPELGYVMLDELERLTIRIGRTHLPAIERDLHFPPQYPLSVYTEAARRAGRIVEYGAEIEAAETAGAAS